MLVENLSNQPHMTEWAHQGTLEHPLDRPRSHHLERVFLHGTVFDCSRAEGSPDPLPEREKPNANALQPDQEKGANFA